MITGDCPYCEQLIINYMPDKTPQFSKNTCENCGEQYWMYYSRIDPIAYSREGFKKEFIVDEKKKSIKERNPTPPTMMTKHQLEEFDKHMKKIDEDISDDIFSDGTGFHGCGLSELINKLPEKE